jgi:hypothetical protein
MPETRKGPPFSYVREKLRRAVESAHDTYQAIERDVPDNLPKPQGRAEVRAGHRPRIRASFPT